MIIFILCVLFNVFIFFFAECFSFPMLELARCYTAITGTAKAVVYDENWEDERWLIARAPTLFAERHHFSNSIEKNCPLIPDPSPAGRRGLAWGERQTWRCGQSTALN